MKIYHLIYRITNKINGHFYIGIHSTSNIEDGYMGSGTLLKSAIRKYGYENFSREIIELFEDRSSALSREAELVNITLLRNPQCYNLVLGGGRVGKPIYSVKAEKIINTPKVIAAFDKKYEYRVDLLHKTYVANPEVLTEFGKAFWSYITSEDILEVITKLYNSARGNNLANKYIQLLERIDAFKHNIVIYRYPKSTLENNRWQGV